MLAHPVMLLHSFSSLEVLLDVLHETFVFFCSIAFLPRKSFVYLLLSKNAALCQVNEELCTHQGS